MKYLGLVLSGLSRKPLRSFLTIASFFLAFLLFGLLQPVADIFSGAGNESTSTRLVVSPKHSVSDMLLLSQVSQLKQLEGIKTVSHQTWFGGEYQDGASTFATYAVPPMEFFEVFSEYTLSSEQVQAFQSIRTSAIIGRSTAELYDMEVGDKLPIIPTIWFNSDSSAWEFDIVGIYDGEDDAVDTSTVFINFDLFDEYRAFCHGCISNFVLELNESSQPETVAAQVDALFANSAFETTTTTAQAWALNFMRQMGNIGLIVRGILAAVFFTILLLSSNTMSQSMRERIPELAILKTLGFQGETLSLLVLSESLIMTLGGAILGLLGASFALREIAKASSQFAGITISAEVFGLGITLSILIAFIIGVPPALRAMRLNIIDALQG